MTNLIILAIAIVTNIVPHEAQSHQIPCDCFPCALYCTTNIPAFTSTNITQKTTVGFIDCETTSTNGISYIQQWEGEQVITTNRMGAIAPERLKWMMEMLQNNKAEIAKLNSELHTTRLPSFNYSVEISVDLECQTNVVGVIEKTISP